MSVGTYKVGKGLLTDLRAQTSSKCLKR